MIYNIVFAIGVIIPITLLIDAVGDVQVILLLFCLAEIAYASLAMLFIPKLLQYKAAQLDAVSAGASSSGTDSYSFLPLENLSSPAQLAAYVTALQKHMDEARKAMHKQKVVAVGSTTALTPTASGLSNSTLRVEPRLSLSTGTAAASTVGLVDGLAVSSSPSIRVSSRVQPQAQSDSARNWRLSESRRVAWTPTRSSRSDPSGATPRNEPSPHKPQAEIADNEVEAATLAHNRVQSSLSVQPPPQQTRDEGRSSRAPSINAVGAASIIATAATSDDGLCAED